MTSDKYKRLRKRLGLTQQQLYEHDSQSASPSACQHRIVRHLDLFSGIGGFALAAQRVGGIKTVGFCEIDTWAQKVLKKNFPQVPIHGDVKTLEGTEYGRIDLITGGYPCQPFSLAGRRGGTEDDRHLWPEVRRIVARARPRYCLFENVTGHVTLGLDEVLSDLDSLGYSSRPCLLPAIAVGSYHTRERVWIMAHSSSERLEGWEEEWENWRGDEALAENRFQSPSIADALRKANGLPHRVDRIRGLGNAIVPQVAEEILRVMLLANAKGLPPAEQPNDFES